MRVYPRWRRETEKLLFIFIIITLAHLQSVCSADDVQSQTPQSGQYTLAEINISYKDTSNSKSSLEFQFQGKFGLKSEVREEIGIVMHAVSVAKSKKNHWGCREYDAKIPSVDWIALVQRGGCSFDDKVKIATGSLNASAVVVYDYGHGSNYNAIMSQKVRNGMSVFISKTDGDKIINCLKEATSVTMHIVPGEVVTFDHSAENNISKTSVLFVSISFIVLMIISLAWLVFYYIQRFRYSHAKERLARRLACAAKKAIAKIPQSTVKSGDKVLEGDHDQCAVCIEQYKLHDVIRILPCSHVFHKSCVDPWLQENRSCPMCKMDILAAYGMQIGASQESVHHNADPGPNTQLVIEDPEVSSSFEEAVAPTEVVLPFICLHKNQEGDDEETQQSSQLLGVGLSSENIKLSSTSLNSNKGANSGIGSVSLLSRVEKRDKEESNNIEMKALIEKVSNDDEDEHDNNTINSDKSDNGGRMLKENGGCDVDETSDDFCSSLLNVKNGSQRNDTNSSPPEDNRCNKDTISIMVFDTGGGDSVGAVEFHQEQDLSPSNSF